MKDEKSIVEAQVKGFISSECGYDPCKDGKLTITHSEGSWSILYGKSVEAGILGTGGTSDAAYQDFLDKWKAFKGFEWIDKVKNFI